ncbi:MAG: tetratricopeptide repeat protein [Candidatus Aquicultorales bacterium]
MVHESNDFAVGRAGAPDSGANNTDNLLKVYEPRRGRRAKTVPEVFKPKPVDYLVKALKLVAVLGVVGFVGYYGVGAYQSTKESVPLNKISPVLEQEVRSKPRDQGARMALANAYLNQGFFENAIEQYEQVLKLNKNSQEAYVGLGLSYMKKGDEDQALDWFEKEIEVGKKGEYRKMNASLEMAYYYAGTLWFKKNHYDKALDYLKQAASIKTGSSDTYMAIGRILLEKKDFKAAATEFERALAFDPKFPDAHYGLGIALEKMGRKSEALARYREAVKLSPNFKLAKEAVERLDNR